MPVACRLKMRVVCVLGGRFEVRCAWKPGQVRHAGCHEVLSGYIVCERAKAVYEEASAPHDTNSLVAASSNTEQLCKCLLT